MVLNSRLGIFSNFSEVLSEIEREIVPSVVKRYVGVWV